MAAHLPTMDSDPATAGGVRTDTVGPAYAEIARRARASIRCDLVCFAAARGPRPASRGYGELHIDDDTVIALIVMSAETIDRRFALERAKLRAHLDISRKGLSPHRCNPSF